ncbi:MAG: DUF2182 domain-containing protein [Pikeienuella sp.]
MSVLTKVDDPRFLTVAVTVLFAAALWLATWSVMGTMDMNAMQMGGGTKMDGMSMPQADGQAMAPADGTMQGMSEGSSGGMGTEMKPEASTGMKMGETSSGMDASNMDAGNMNMGNMGMGQMDMFGMSMDPTDWSLRTVMETSAMWLLMMAAMMLPAMAPVMSVYAGVSAKEDEGLRLALRITLFAVSYFILWAAFSIGAAILQMVWRGSDYFTMGGTQATPIAAGVLLLIAGLYQFTPLKDACLKHCRHPLQYLLAHWKPGLAGAFPVGARHGLYCFGCCVAFMGLMFVFGAMNVWWMAVIALYFLAEKILPKAEIWGKLTGAGLTAAGIYMLATSV